MTSLNDVYDFFLSKVTDYSFLRLNDEGILDDVLLSHLRSAIVRFNVCDKDLTINDSTKQFNVDLDIEEQEILSTLMVLSYTNGKILTVKNMEQILSDKEYQRYSTANHLRELQNVKLGIQSEVSHLMSAYSFKHELEYLQ